MSITINLKEHPELKSQDRLKAEEEIRLNKINASIPPTYREERGFPNTTSFPSPHPKEDLRRWL